MKLFPADTADLATVWAGALCAQVDPELFFPEKGARDGRLAKQICAACDVRELCLATFGPFMREGIVGGTSPKERRGMRRAARKAAA